MAWNRSKIENGKCRIGNERKSAALNRRFAIVAAALLAVAGGAAWWMAARRAGGNESEGAAVARRDKTIAESAHKVTTNAVMSTEQDVQHKGMVKVRGKWYPEYNEKGGRIWVTKNEVRYHTPVVVTNKIDDSRIRPERKVFDNKAEQEIAILLNTPLGTTMIGKRVYGKAFEERFLESISNPIIVTPDDDDQTAALKRAVVEAKLAMKERHDRGESVAEIMNDTYREMRDLSAYREDLKREAKAMMTSAKGSEEESRIIFEAANKMLAERGLKPLREPVLLKNKLKLENRKSKME